MIKLILCIGIIAGSSYIGFGIASYYDKRKKFFSDYLNFLNHAKTQISFFQNRLSHIFTSFSANSSDLEKLLKAFASRLEKGTECPKKPTYIKQAEWQTISQFLTNMGKADVENECANIEAMINTTKQIYQSALEECKTKYNLSIKMGVAIVFVITIIIF